MKRLRTLVITSLAAVSLAYLVSGCGLFVEKNIHSSEANSPYSVLEGTTIRVEPYDATFEIPEDWVIPREQKNLFLSWQELDHLDEMEDYGIKFDEENGAVIDSILPFEYCAAHFGSKSWNNGNWNDLQSRFYIVEMTQDDFAEKVGKSGLNKARNVFEKADLVVEFHNDWQKFSIKVLDAPTHFLLFKNIDLYYRNYRGKSAVFAFVHAGGFDETIDQILRSFKPGGAISSD
jgi:hypothetical protein